MYPRKILDFNSFSKIFKHIFLQINKSTTNVQFQFVSSPLVSSFLILIISMINLCSFIRLKIWLKEQFK